MKYREILINQFKSLPHFDKEAIYRLSEQYKIKKTTVDAYIVRSLARKDLVQLKKGTYTTADFYEKNKEDISYKFYLANVLRTPSYITSWTALQYYDLTTEVITAITSVTPKITRSYNNKAGNFVYHSIKKKLFTGFSLVKGRFDYFLATPSKALFDLLYFRTRQFRGIRLGNIDELIAELRIDIDEMKHNERAAFYKMLKDVLRS